MFLGRSKRCHWSLWFSISKRFVKIRGFLCSFLWFPNHVSYLHIFWWGVTEHMVLLGRWLQSLFCFNINTKRNAKTHEGVLPYFIHEPNSTTTRKCFFFSLFLLLFFPGLATIVGMELYQETTDNHSSSKMNFFHYSYWSGVLLFVTWVSTWLCLLFLFSAGLLVHLWCRLSTLYLDLCLFLDL